MENYQNAYKEALKRARDYYKANIKLDKADENLVLEDIFPELQELEDEKVRKALIRFHKGTIDIDGIKGEDIIAWLEKQAERKTPQWMIDFLDNYRRMIGCSLDYDEARDVDGKILCIKEWLEKQDTVIKDTISMDVSSETEWDDIHKFLRMNLDGEKVKLLIVMEE